MTVRRCTVSAALLMLCTALTACQPVFKAKPMTDQETRRVQEFTAQMKPRCLGWYVIDFPAAFVLNSESSAQMNDVRIKVKLQDRALFDLHLAARRAQLETVMLPGKIRNRPQLRATIPLPDKGIGVVFDRSENAASTGRLARTLELVAWRDGYRIEATVNATDTSFPEDANDSLTTQLKTDVAEKLALLLGVSSKVRGRPESEIPTEAGTCIANGFIAGPSSNRQSIQMAYHLDGTQDVYFNLFAQTEVREETTMLERSAQIEAEIKGNNTETIRKSARNIRALPYEEWLMRGPTLERVPGTEFALQANEKGAGPAKPSLELKFYNGFRIPHPKQSLEEMAQTADLTKASLTEAEQLPFGRRSRRRFDRDR